MRRLAFALALAAVLFVIPLQGCLATPSGATGGMESVGEAFDYLRQEYIDPSKVTSQEMSRAAIEGMIGKLNDPWTYYLDSSTYQLHQRSLQGRYSGIGARVSLDEGNLTIVTVFPGSPAEKAGLKPGDSIRAVNGEPVSGMANVQEAVLKVQGPRGSTIRLLVLKVGQTDPQELSLVRAEISVPSATLEKRGDVALVSLLQFTDRSDQEMRMVLSEALNTGSRALILDLRDNPGGPLETVVNTTGLFLKKGQTVLTVADRAGGKDDRKVAEDGLASTVPMVVLVNQHSASGSEVLAGALQDHKRATVAGVKTTGKGSVNRIVPLKDGSAMSITVARWLTPSGHAIEGNGLVPDVTSELQGEELVAWAIEFLRSTK